MSKQAISDTGAWCVRFVNGALAGRAFALKPGTNVVGSADDCDIIVPGDVLPRHLLFMVGDIAVSVRKFGTAAVQLNGQELPLHRRSVVRGDMISLGDMEFELDRLQPGDEAGHARIESKSPDGGSAPDMTQAPRLSDSAEKAPRYGAGALIAVAVAAVAVSTAIGLRAFEHPRGNVQPRSAIKLDMATLEGALTDFPDIELTMNPDGTASIQGYVTSAARKSTLLRTLEPFGARVSADIHVTDEILQRARSFLNQPGVVVSYTGRGRLVVSGSVESETVRQKIKRLGQDLLPAVTVHDHVQYVRAGANDPQAELAAWQNTLPSAMVGLTEYANGLRQIQLANGQRYYEGATLKSGDQLANIEADRLVVTNGRAAATPAAAAEPLAERSPEGVSR